MAACGVSAGGTLAMNYAYTSAETSAVPVKFVFQLAGPAEFEAKDWDILKKVNKLKSDKDFLSMMTGVDITEEMIESGESEPYINVSRTRQHRHLKRKDSIRFLVFLDFSHFWSA